MFVDNSGRRARLLRRLGLLLGAVCVGYAAVLGLAFLGIGTSLNPSSLLPFGGGQDGGGPAPGGGTGPQGGALPTGPPPTGAPPSGAPAAPGPTASPPPTAPPGPSPPTPPAAD
ncbi:hypothetical protein [Streptomyces sp. WAC04189]|uniref:hypothetical protein n=1 Tax=Streptomyces sp. WAC04189 TaxID=2487411 RepID=UPI00163BB016|nr:hypothetical protein [Streptomyces sp. WAC04189]